jgi:hypothetical protein
MPDDDERKIGDEDPPQGEPPATGERADRQPSPPGVEIRETGAPEAPPGERTGEEPEPGEHANP